MKPISIAISSRDNEVINDLKDNIAGNDLLVYHGIDQIRHEGYDILLVDFQLFDDPEGAQFFLSKIRKKVHEIVVVLILRVNALGDLKHDWFINDFIVYPFRRGELMARLDRILWINHHEEETISLGSIRISINDYAVYQGNDKLELTYKEFELLKLFVQNRGTVFSRKDLLGTIWGLEYIGGTRTVDVHIRRLRSKLGEEFNTYIETVRNVGYRCTEG